MSISDSQIRATTAFETKNYDKILIRFQKGMKEQIKAKADEAGVSVNRYILEAVEARSGLKLTLDNDLPWIKKDE